ncbi:hemicentin-2-like [Solea solea]|uniref:hemicentin-2-like n=1 Tax=Solea solea TaxID=90069 RepID=UPI00272CBABD|nr:hemicentin-2-like [Solea solea]
MLHLLMLALFLGDVDSTCSESKTTLRLVPLEVLEEYGGEVLVNCTSEDGIHDWMYWKHGNRKSNLTEEDFTSWTLSLSEWNVTTAKCILMLPGGIECSEDLEITLYKNPDSVTLYPTQYVNNLVEGTLYELQCDIVEVAPIQNLTIRWYKDNQVVRTETFTSNTTRTPVSESSLFTVNISREDDGAGFRCEAQLNFGPHRSEQPVLSELHVISVYYAPELNGTADEGVHVVQGGNITLACDAKGNPPPDFRWTRDGVNMTEDKSYVNVSQVNTNVTYVCTATNRVGTTTKRIHVYVREDVVEAPADAVTPPEPPIDCSLKVPDKVVVRFGDPLSIDCVTTATDVFRMSWKESNVLRFHISPTATWKMEKVEDWNIKPECQVSLTSGHVCSATPAITVYKTPDVVSLSANADGLMVEDTVNLLTCHIVNVAPVQNLTVTLYRGNKTVSTRGFNSTMATPANVSTDFSLIPVRDDDGAQYRCSAELHLGQQTVPATSSEPYTAVVHYKPLMNHCPAGFSGLEGTFSLDTLQCQAEGNPPPTVRWYYRGRPVNASAALTRDHSGTYMVELLSSVGRNNRTVDITVEYGPLFTCDSQYRVKEHDKVQRMCDPEGAPTPTIRWFKGGNEIGPPQHWTKQDSGVYDLKAENQHGTANHTLSLDVWFAPEIKEENVSMEFTPGENVTLDCHAEGNPVPKVLWKNTAAVNVMQTTGGHHGSIRVTVATSTNAGVYICVATNEVGTVSRSVTLLMKGQAFGRRLSFILWPLLVIFIILFFIVLFMLCRCRKKHGQYSFIADQDIPLMTKSDGRKV